MGSHLCCTLWLSNSEEAADLDSQWFLCRAYSRRVHWECLRDRRNVSPDLCVFWNFSGRLQAPDFGRPSDSEPGRFTLKFAAASLTDSRCEINPPCRSLYVSGSHTSVYMRRLVRLYSLTSGIILCPQRQVRAYPPCSEYPRSPKRLLIRPFVVEPVTDAITEVCERWVGLVDNVGEIAIGHHCSPLPARAGKRGW
jgi:hypothetical protein